MALWPWRRPALSPAEIEAPPPAAQEIFWTYRFFLERIGLHVPSLDNGRFINRVSDGAKLRASAERHAAITANAVGDELFVNDNDFDPTCWSTPPEAKAAFAAVLRDDLARRGLL